MSGGGGEVFYGKPVGYRTNTTKVKACFLRAKAFDWNVYYAGQL
jgi:hypothetical protein